MSNTTATAPENAAAKKALAKKTQSQPHTKNAADKPVTKKRTYRATGRAGRVNTRSFDGERTVAVDVRDESHPSKLWQLGVITRFYKDAQAAEGYVERMRAAGCDVLIVEAEEVK